MGNQGSRGFDYSVEDSVWSNSIWNLHHGKHSSDGNEVSIFVQQRNSPVAACFVGRAEKRMKSLLHPCLLKYSAGTQIEDIFHIVTEPVVPLQEWMKDGSMSIHARRNSAIWGLFCIAKALDFLHTQGISHGNIQVDSVFVTKKGDWKLFGLEFLSKTTEDDLESVVVERNRELSSEILPPEMRSSRKGRIDLLASDVWQFGNLAVTCSEFCSDNVYLQNVKFLEKLSLSRNPVERKNMKELLRNNFFRVEFVKVQLFFENIQLKEKAQKESFYTNLRNKSNEFPPHSVQFKFVPSLFNTASLGQDSKALEIALELSKSIESDEEYQKIVVHNIIDIFKKPDREARLVLLKSLPAHVDRLPSSMFDSVFVKNFSVGFSDPSPAIREISLKSVAMLASKIPSDLLSNDVIRNLWTLQSDAEPAIRTNATICIGKIAPFITDHARAKILLPAFMRSLRDPFLRAQASALLALSVFVVTQTYFSAKDVAVKVIPSISPFLISSNTEVRKNAFNCMEKLLMKLKSHSSEISSPQLNENHEEESFISRAMSSVKSIGMKTAVSSSNVVEVKEASPKKERSGSLDVTYHSQLVDDTNETWEDDFGGWDGEDEALGVFEDEDILVPTTFPSEIVQESQPTASFFSDSSEVEEDPFEDDGWEVFNDDTAVPSPEANEKQPEKVEDPFASLFDKGQKSGSSLLGEEISTVPFPSSSSDLETKTPSRRSGKPVKFGAVKRKAL